MLELALRLPAGLDTQSPLKNSAQYLAKYELKRVLHPDALREHFAQQKKNILLSNSLGISHFTEPRNH